MKRLLLSGFLAAALMVLSQNAWAGGCDPAYAQALYNNLIHEQHMSPASARFYVEKRHCGSVVVSPPAQVHNYPPNYSQTQAVYSGYAQPAQDSGGYYGPTFVEVVGVLAAVGLGIWAIDELSDDHDHDNHGHHGGHGGGHYYKGGHYGGGHPGGGHYGGYRGGHHGGHNSRHR